VISSAPGAHTQEAFERAVRRPLTSRREFSDAIGAAVRARRPYATGKLGVSERSWLAYPMLLAAGLGERQRWAYEQSLKVKATQMSGVFPATGSFYERFADFHAEQVRRLDSIGVATNAYAETLAIVRHHGIEADFTRYKWQEPDRSTPADDSLCYLPHFAGKRVLLVAPFADLLRERATRATFEAVWAKTGKRWFEPASVEAVEFPYGFARATQERYATCLGLLDDVTRRIDEHDYDVALIAAAALAIPLATHAAARGKVAIVLGGALQVLFGVLGERWRERESWKQRYFNKAWIDMPALYRPEPEDTFEDGYW
jgi:hypothetical protein